MVFLIILVYPNSCPKGVPLISVSDNSDLFSGSLFWEGDMFCLFGCSSCCVFMSTQAFMLYPSSWNVRWLIILFWFTEQILSRQQCILAQKAVLEGWHVIYGFIQSNYCHFHQCFYDIDMHPLRKITKATEVAARQSFSPFWLGNFLKDTIELEGSDKHP